MASWSRVFSAASRLSRLNSCPRCGHTWYARGHLHSRSCPSCRANLTAQARSSSAGAGCGIALLALAAFVVLFTVYSWTTKVLGSAAVPVDVGVIALVGAGALVVRHQLRRRAERARLAAMQAAQQAWNERRQALVARFGEVAAENIVNRTLWQGATPEMVSEMLGPPADIARRVLKTKSKETWKYRPLGSDRWGLQVIFENGVCVGWDEK